VLELIVKRGRALVNARTVLIMLPEGADLVVVASAGETTQPRRARLPIAGSTSGEVLARRRVQRISDIQGGLRVPPETFGVQAAHSALLVPLVYRGRSLGVLAAYDRRGESTSFSDEDEQLLRSFAASAATAVATAQSVLGDRVRHSLEAADAERRHWARELHDETLQGLAGLRVMLAGVLRHAASNETEASLTDAIGEVEREIDNLRAIITDLRPAALDELGLEPAVETLLARHRAIHGLEIDSDIKIVGTTTDGVGAGRLTPELETTIYRLIQESLTNVAKHADAERVEVVVRERGLRIEVHIRDDGRGFDAAARTTGYGLTGIRERVELAGGHLRIDSGPHGTRVGATMPARYVARRARP
jgi:signal transduction histidine kinase